MRQAGRYILNALTALSLVFFLGTLGLWIRGSARRKPWDVVIGDHFFGIINTEDDKIVWVWLRLLDQIPARDVTLAKFTFAGISYEHLLLDNGVDQSAAEAPAWLPYLFFPLLPIFWFARRVSDARAARLGRRKSCNYDLRATPSRCPECGIPALPAEATP